MSTDQVLARPLPPKFDHLPTIKRWLMTALAKIHHGKLMVYLDGQHYLCGNEQGIEDTESFDAMIRIHKPFKMAQRGLLRGDLGFAESYLAGDWSTDDLGALLNLLLRNKESIGEPMTGQQLLRRGANLYHRLRRNSRSGSRKNIQYHYDLGNDFYKEWLDDSMTYSSALFQGTDDLKQAQQNKYQRILDELGEQANQSILEIGCGWGGFAEMAVDAGHHVHGITLSSEQLAYAEQRLAPYDKQARLELLDYRDLTETYDSIVSIEMFEAVGEQYWDTYFEVLERSLKPGGKAVLQIITIDNEHFDNYRNRPDYIQRYIFPGGMLPSPERLQQQIDKTKLVCKNQLSFGKDYARTIAEWDRSFVKALPTLKKLGYDQRFERMWRYYLAYCEAGFEQGRIDVVQLTLEKP